MADERIIIKLSVLFIDSAANDIYGHGWAPGTLTITNRNLWFSRQGKHTQHSINSIIMLGRGGNFPPGSQLRGENISGVDYTKDLVIDYFALGRYQTTVIRADRDIRNHIKSVAFHILLDNIQIKYVSPVNIGGVLRKDAAWVEGTLAVRGASLLLSSGDYDSVLIPFESIAGVKHDTSGQSGTVVIDHQTESGELRASWLQLPGTGGDMLHSFLEQKLSELTSAGRRAGAAAAPDGTALDGYSNLSEDDLAAITALYSSDMDSTALEEILGKTPDEVGDILTRLVKLDLAKIVRVRKDAALTQKGMNFIVSAVQKQADESQASLGKR